MTSEERCGVTLRSGNALQISALVAEIFLSDTRVVKRQTGGLILKRSFIAVILAALSLLTLSSGVGIASAKNSHRAPRLSAGPARFPVTLTDDAGHQVTVLKPPVRIASATEGTDEILSGLVAKRHIVLVTGFATDPAYSNIVAYAKGIRAIGGSGSLDAEQIIAVHPDLVLLASYTTPSVTRQIEQAHIPAYEFADFHSIAGIEHNITVVGQLVGNPRGAAAMLRTMNLRLARLRKAIGQGQRPTVLDYSSFGFVAGSGTTVNDIIQDAGGINAAAGIQGWQHVSQEEIVKLNPDVIVDGAADASFIASLLHNPAFSTVAAVRNHEVYAINNADLDSVSQYIIRAVYDLAHVLHPASALPK